MAEVKWTPGPWVVRYDDRVTVPEDNNGALSIAHIYDKGRVQQHANQHLIAAAPDLYEALDKLMHELGEASDQGMETAVPDSVYRTARDALAKARGESLSSS